MSFATTELPSHTIAKLASEYPEAGHVLRSATPLRLHGGEESAAYRLGEFVVRVGARWRSAAELEWSGQVASAVADAVTEVIAPLGCASGRAVHVIEGHPITVWPFVAGAWADRANRRHFDSAAALLARVHRALAAAPLGPPPASDRRLGDTSDLTDHRLDEWLRAFSRDHLRRHALHGDYYPGNVLAVGDRLVGLLDWDEAFVGSPESELAVAAWEWGDCLRTGQLSKALEFAACYCRTRGTATALDDVALRQLIRRRLRWEAGVRRSDNAQEPQGAYDNAYAAAQIAAFHDLAPS